MWAIDSQGREAKVSRTLRLTEPKATRAFKARNGYLSKRTGDVSLNDAHTIHGRGWLTGASPKSGNPEMWGRREHNCLKSRRYNRFPLATRV
jgi:hypothetical protein